MVHSCQVCPHACELVFAFGDSLGVTQGKEAALAAAMGRLWSDFAVAGKPGGGWPQFELRTPANDTFFVLDEEMSGPAPHPYEAAQCDWWDRVRAERQEPRLRAELLMPASEPANSIWNALPYVPAVGGEGLL
jgi:carboxylesterase type B